MFDLRLKYIQVPVLTEVQVLTECNHCSKSHIRKSPDLNRPGGIPEHVV